MLSDKLGIVRNEVQGLNPELAWYRSFSLDQALATAGDLDRKVVEWRARLSELEMSLNSLRASLARPRAQGAYGWNPTQWFSEERIRLRRQTGACETEIASVLVQVSNTQTGLDADAGEHEEALGQIRRHGAVSESALIGRIESLQSDQ